MGIGTLRSHDVQNSANAIKEEEVATSMLSVEAMTESTNVSAEVHTVEMVTTVTRTNARRGIIKPVTSSLIVRGYPTIITNVNVAQGTPETVSIVKVKNQHLTLEFRNN